jgi:4-carboxymuconolactone decarboxylase
MANEGRLPAIPPEQLTPEQKKVLDALQSGPRGAGVRGPFHALLRSPELCDLVQRVGAYVRYSTSLPAKLNELAICMAGRKWTAQYEFYAHRRLAIQAGLKQEIADAVAAGTRPPGMDADEAAVYDFATELLSSGQVADAKYEGVKSRFGERGVMDLVGAVGYYSLVSMVLNVAQVPLPPGEAPPLKPL